MLCPCELDSICTSASNWERMKLRAYWFWKGLKTRVGTSRIRRRDRGWCTDSSSGNGVHFHVSTGHLALHVSSAKPCSSVYRVKGWRRMIDYIINIWRGEAGRAASGHLELNNQRRLAVHQVYTSYTVRLPSDFISL